jgi:hypothetical protein
MKKRLMAGFGAAALLVAATTGVASAAPPETTDGFVCPVLNSQVGENENGNTPFFEIADGSYSLLGPEVTVPVTATNADGSGAPSGPYASPGDTDYTAIWATD